MTEEYENFAELATNPRQYDKGEVRWTHQNGIEELLHDHLMYSGLHPHLLPQDVVGRNVLDIGCGTGWLSREIAARGAKVTAIDPSQTNIEFAEKANPHPNIKYLNVSLEQFRADEEYDIVTASMVFEHMPQLSEALHRVHDLTTHLGRLVVVEGDKAFMSGQRLNYSVDTQEIDDEEVAVRTDYGNSLGVLYDIFRSSDKLIREANRAGYREFTHDFVTLEGQFSNLLTAYETIKKLPAFHIYRFDRVD